MTDDPVQLNAAGLQALGQGDFAAATALLSRAAAADPQAALLWFNLATAQGAAGQADAEMQSIDRALDCDPYLVHALLAKARLTELAGDQRGALDHYQRLLAAINPNDRYPPALADGIGHARSVIAAASAALGDTLDTALAPALTAIAPEVSERFRHAMDVQLGRRRLYTQQPLVLAYPYLPAEQFLARSHFPWLAQLEAATPVIRAELEALLAAGDAGFAPYVAYPPGAPVNQWAQLNHNDAWAAQFLWRDGVPQDVMRARCPQTAAVLDALPLFDLPGRGPVAFFSLLKPHTHIPPHTGATNIRTIIHLPLIVPEDCRFRVGNETRPWVEGESFAFDDTIEHEAWNGSNALRAVLIIDTWNPHLSLPERDLLRRYCATLDAAGNALGAFQA